MATSVVLRYDLRAPAFAGVTHSELYAACLEQCAWADEHGLSGVTLAEHHGSEDGYLPSPLTLGAAIAGCTKRLSIAIAAVIAPLHDPVRLAEQVAVLELVSGGRAVLFAVPGYRHEEFEMAGVDRAQRWGLLEENVEVMRKAWSGEPFEWRGRTVRVTPKPRVQPTLIIGGVTEAAARRAARLLAGYNPSSSQDPRLPEAYYAECARIGWDGGFVAGSSAIACVHVSEDPERDWARIAPHALYEAQAYASWRDPVLAGRPAPTSAEELRQTGAYRVVTPDECVALAGQTGSILLHPLLAGMPLDLGWASLELFAAKVLPRIREQ
jgi:alkanesulfonate monooxygenase SsuD/methylene tetrahydromethanopterin reductase-like flavin-dependent oxidoreductase (luciferase family)